MRLLMAVSLILSIPGLAIADPDRKAAIAPGLPTLPPGLTLAPGGPDGTLVPPDHAKALRKLLEECRRLPVLCQSHLDAMGLEYDGRVAGAVRMERADCLGSRVEAGGGVYTWQALLGGAVLVVLAGGVGYLAGKLAP